jgi:hypothetical protein
MFIPDPGSRIQKQQQKREVKKNLLSYFFCSHKFHKIEYYVIFEMLKKKIWANFQRIVEVFYPKKFQNALKYMGLGYRGQKGTGSRIRIRNTANYGSGRQYRQRKGIAAYVVSDSYQNNKNVALSDRLFEGWSESVEGH